MPKFELWGPSGWLVSGFRPENLVLLGPSVSLRGFWVWAGGGQQLRAFGVGMST